MVSLDYFYHHFSHHQNHHRHHQNHHVTASGVYPKAKDRIDTAYNERSDRSYANNFLDSTKAKPSPRHRSQGLSN